MLFSQLPIELKLMILECLDDHYFSDDIRRLTVCKWWYALARRSLFAHLVLAPQRAGRHATKLYHYELRSNQYNIMPFLQELKLYLPDERSIMLPGGGFWGAPATPARGEAYLRLVQSVMRRSRRLRSLTLVTVPKHNYRMTRASINFIQDLPNFRFLTKLDIDLRGEQSLEPCNQFPNTECHVCLRIGLLFPYLRELKVQSRTLCPAIWAPSRRIAAALPMESMTLRMTDHWGIPPGNHSNSQFLIMLRGFVQARMTRARSVRVCIMGRLHEIRVWAHHCVDIPTNAHVLEYSFGPRGCDNQSSMCHA